MKEDYVISKTWQPFDMIHMTTWLINFMNEIGIYVKEFFSDENSEKSKVFFS